jgi:hypothetical protein
MSSPAHLDATSGALVSSTAGALSPGSATRSNAPVVLSLDASNYTKWGIYMRVILMVLGGAYTLVFRTMEFGWCEERDDRLWSI